MLSALSIIFTLLPLKNRNCFVSPPVFSLANCSKRTPPSICSAQQYRLANPIEFRPLTVSDFHPVLPVRVACGASRPASFSFADSFVPTFSQNCQSSKPIIATDGKNRSSGVKPFGQLRSRPLTAHRFYHADRAFPTSRRPDNGTRPKKRLDAQSATFRPATFGGPLPLPHPNPDGARRGSVRCKARSSRPDVLNSK